MLLLFDQTDEAGIGKDQVIEKVNKEGFCITYLIELL